VHHSAADLDAYATSEGAGLYARLAACGWNPRYRFGNSLAWEEDFKRAAAPGGGKEYQYLDTVDLQFYVGHGWPGGFTFANAAHDDNALTPADCFDAWGDGDNEWVALTSCQVLADSSLPNWAACFNGTHLILGFKTNASARLGIDTQGYNFAKYLCQGYTVPQAWYKAADRSQPSGRVVRALINELAYLNDRPMCGAGSCPLAADSYDTDAWVQTHVAGSEPARYVNIAALGEVMPVYRTAPLSLAEAVTRYNDLGSAFNVPVTPPRILGPSSAVAVVTGPDDLWTGVSNGNELELDPAGGLYGYANLNALWTATPTLGLGPEVPMAPVTADDARRVADSFLRQNGLMPGDAQFYEVVSDTISGGSVQPDLGRAASLMANEEPVMWQVIYSRILTATLPRTGEGPDETVAFSVIGPGAKQKVYVSTAVPSGTLSLKGPMAAGILGAQGGWRRLDQPQTRGPQAIETVAILQPSQIYTLHQKLEERVVVNTPPIEADGRTVLSHTVAYWEEAAGGSQGELIPVYALTVSYTQQSQLVAVDYAYIPASPLYMRPWAAIESAPQNAVQVSQTVQLTAVDANRTLADLGVDAGLNFVMGNGDYGYEWYLNAVEPANKIGSGRSIAYQVRPDAFARDGQLRQNIILVVTDLLATNDQSSRAVTTLTVVPRTYIPVVVK
jgi:hypothetical protein